MTDQGFGELDFDGCYWNGHLNLDWFGETRELTLTIGSCHGSQSGISSRQWETLRIFLEKRPGLQQAVVKEIIRYYNEEERFANGPDDPEDFNAWWPEIDTVEEMVKWITLETVVIESDRIAESCREGKRCLYLLFSYRWGGGDRNCGGIGIRLADEMIHETGFQGIAFQAGSLGWNMSQ